MVCRVEMLIPRQHISSNNNKNGEVEILEEIFLNTNIPVATEES